MTTAYTAQADQAQAATQHLARVVREELATGSINASTRPPIGPALRILETFHERLKNDRITQCPHLAANTGQILFWSKWKPGKLQCGTCMIQSARRLTAKQARTCDGCSRLRTHLTPCSPILPSVIDPETGTAQGPIMLQYGLCDKCFQKAHPETESAPGGAGGGRS